MKHRSYDSAISALQAFAIRRGINYSLERFQSLLNQLGNPEKKLPRILHIAGTNGKGSTVAFLKSVLIEHGYTVATYTSPHIYSYRERIQINTTLITDDDFVDTFNQVAIHTQEASEFEILTAMAFLYFSRKQPDIVILETGIGGRLDCTAVVSPECSIITRIGLDHQGILGESIEAIASEKAGIIKKNCPVITLKDQDPKALNVIQNEATRLNAPLYLVSAESSLPDNMNIKGDFQRENLALAKKTIEQLFSIDPDSETSTKGFINAFHWGRYTSIISHGQHIIIDAAHNKEAFESLFESLTKDGFFTNNSALVFGILKRKDLNTILPIISTFPGDLYYDVFSEDAHDFKTVAATLPHIKPYKPDLKGYQHIIITGSILYISQFYHRL